MDGGGFAERIYDYLTDVNYEVFIDWNAVNIEENISKCNLFVPIITPSALRSIQVEKQVSQALREKKVIIPCIHEDVSKLPPQSRLDVKWGLGQFQAIHFYDKYDLALKLSEIPSLVKEDH